MNTICNNTFKMEPGDLLILYTDGITEIMNREDIMFGEEGIKE